ncbi:MAG: 3-hydroxyacyl-CoA dehydrogenase NAD-binding domain-containing protein, partial [Rubrivivax sp.]
MTARFAAVGAGRMGRSIAIAFAYAGHRIALVDLKPRTEEAVQALARQAQDEIAASLRALAELGALQADEVQTIAQRVQFVPAEQAPAALAAAELVFEGVPETLPAKQEALAAISAHVGPEAIVTSTTSSILVTQLAPLVRDPQRFLNAHWLNPAYLIPVVELSTHEGTCSEVLARTREILE